MKAFEKWYTEITQVDYGKGDMQRAFAAGMLAAAEMGFVVICESNEDGTKCDECLAMESAVQDYKDMVIKATED